MSGLRCIYLFIACFINQTRIFNSLQWIIIMVCFALYVWFERSKTKLQSHRPMASSTHLSVHHRAWLCSAAWSHGKPIVCVFTRKSILPVILYSQPCPRESVRPWIKVSRHTKAMFDLTMIQWPILSLILTFVIPFIYLFDPCPLNWPLSTLKTT